MICSKCNNEFDDSLKKPKSRRCPDCHRKCRTASQRKYYRTSDKPKQYAKEYRHRNRFVIINQIKQYKQKFLDKIKIQGKTWRDNLKLDVLSHYCNEGNPNDIKCKCGFADIRALTIDHINGGGTQHRKSTGNFYCWLKNNNYPEGFQVLCMNCQFIKRIENNELGKK